VEQTTQLPWSALQKNICDRPIRKANEEALLHEDLDP
jgi:hypothetical protein